jgi:hypothetical protein
MQRPGRLGQRFERVHLIEQTPPTADFLEMLRFIDQEGRWASLSQTCTNGMSSLVLS